MIMMCRLSRLVGVIRLLYRKICGFWAGVLRVLNKIGDENYVQQLQRVVASMILTACCVVLYKKRQ